MEWPGRDVARGRGTPLAVAIIDIDHFKDVNDTFGHLTGDHVIRAVADTLQAHMRRYDSAGRYGGDEFVLLFPGTTASQAAAIAVRLRDTIAAAPVLTRPQHQNAVTITISTGISELTDPGSGLDELLAAADSGLYSSKRAGRCRVRISRSEHTHLRGVRRVVHIPLMSGTNRRDRGPQRNREPGSIRMRKAAHLAKLKALQAAHRHIRPGLPGQIRLREPRRGPQCLQALTQLRAVHQIQRRSAHGGGQRRQPVRARLHTARLISGHILPRHPGKAGQLGDRQARTLTPDTQLLPVEALHSASRHVHSFPRP